MACPEGSHGSGGDDDVVHIGVIGGLERTAAGNEAQQGTRRSLVHVDGGEGDLLDELYAGDGEGSGRSVAAGDGDAIALVQPAEIVEDGRPGVPRVDVADDDGAA